MSGMSALIEQLRGVEALALGLHIAASDRGQQRPMTLTELGEIVVACGTAAVALEAQDSQPCGMCGGTGIAKPITQAEKDESDGSTAYIRQKLEALTQRNCPKNTSGNGKHCWNWVTGDGHTCLNCGARVDD
jgi:hypothetical protein